MRRSLSGRLLSLVLSLWLPLFMSGAESVVRCPMHSGVGHSAGHSMPMPSAETGHEHGVDHSAPGDQDSGHRCSCPGPGCCPTAVAMVPQVTLPLSRIALIHEARAVSTLDHLSSRRDHALPFATAPPAAALAPSASIVG